MTIANSKRGGVALKVARKKKVSDDIPGLMNFFYQKELGRCLSNFYPCIVEIDDADGEKRTYSSGECAFHGEKYIRVGKMSPDENRKMELMNYGRTFMVSEDGVVMSGEEAKIRGGKKGLFLTKEECAIWSTIGKSVQEEISRYKFDHYEEVRAFLQASNDKILVHPARRCKEEDVGKKYWEGKGVIVDGKLVILGTNMLGNIWMELRSNGSENVMMF
jgi:predicted NAD-dependent protein-ADP-ribosyltransferase YbiA (DUF1768 family)